MVRTPGGLGVRPLLDVEGLEGLGGELLVGMGV
jgi:hypothetical protein